MLTKVSVNVRNRTTNGVVLSKIDKPKFKTLEVLEVSEFYYSKKQLELARFIATYYVCSLGEALGIMMPFSHTSGEAEKKDAEVESISKIVLSQKQSDALEFLKQHETSLLFGDTGSGKTEIYMKYFEAMISQKKRSIFLMPEISLTPQMSKRLEVHFGDSVVMWHSKLTPLQKKKALLKIYDGSAKIVAGPRSALFLPIKDIALIVVDEEHDDSYKSSSRPRYHARDLSIYMGKLYGARVVLGSATPSLSSFVKFPHIRVRGTHFSTKKRFIYEKSKEELSPLIFEQIQRAIDAKSQVIVFLPTRANFKYLLCESCGSSVECAYCSVGMSVHERSNALKCHYCNYTQAIPKVCQKCKGGSLVSSRLGTAQALKVIEERFSEVKVELFDRDAITSAKKLRDALERFNTQETSILVGTQMLSKGHDYHGVTLAVVLGLDNMLNMSDYRARQNALSSLIQVSGRSGRAKDALVLVQTFNEEFFSRFIDDYDAFLQEEIGFREGLYPPYKKLCRILFAHKNATKAQDEMHKMLEPLLKIVDVEVVGFGACVLERVADRYRFEIVLRSDKSTSLIRAIKSCKVALGEVDMDPIDFS